MTTRSFVPTLCVCGGAMKFVSKANGVARYVCVLNSKHIVEVADYVVAQ